MKKVNRHERILLFFVGILASFGCYQKWRKQKGIAEQENKSASDKILDFYQLTLHWLEAKNLGGSAAEYFHYMNYKKIAIYGMGELANRLFEDLGNTDIEIVYGIDREICSAPTRTAEVYRPEEQLPPVDVIVVTPFYAMEEIQKSLEEKVRCPIVSLEEVIWSI